MKKIFSKTILLGMLAIIASCKTGSYLESKDGFILVHLRGTPYERGAAYGQMLKEEIYETISRWKQEVETTFERDLADVVDEFFSTTSYLESIESIDPDLPDEVYGMSESTGIDYYTLLAFQMSEEIFIAMDQDIPSNCTSLGYARTDSTASILGQNMDPPKFLHGHPLVLHVIPEEGGPERYLFSVPGLLGLAGLNERGVAITCMGISMLNHSKFGLPVISVVRKVLTQSGLQEAESFLRQTKFAIPQCFGVGGPGGLRCFECSANQVAEFYPFGERNVVLHTNYSINNRDFNPGFIDLLAQYGKSVDDPYFCPRYFHAYDEIENYNRSLDVNRIEALLRLPEPDLESILNENTLGTLVMELDCTPTLFLALGAKEEEPFRALSFD